MLTATTLTVQESPKRYGIKSGEFKTVTEVCSTFVGKTVHFSVAIYIHEKLDKNRGTLFFRSSLVR